MLKALKIKNYALIDEVEVEFGKGLTIITGETGAGKSILIGALSLLTGVRADTSVLKDKQEKCVVEGIFDISKYALEDFFEDNDLDYDDITIIRREITPKGRTRAFINDTPVNLSLLKELSSYLIDIHSQHDTLLLNNPNYQIDVLDAFAGNEQLRRQFQEKYLIYRDLQKQLDELKQKAAKEKADYDYYQFQFEQLEQAELQEDEQEQLEEEQQQLSHIEEIKNALGQITYLLTDEEIGALDKVRQAQRAAQSITDFFPAAEQLASRLESTYLELEDIASEAQLQYNDVEYNPERLQQVNQRLDLIYELQRKFGVTTVRELIDIKNDFEQKLLAINNYDEQIEHLEQQVRTAYEQVMELAQKLSDRRQANTHLLEQEIMQLLHQLGMPNAVFKVQIDRVEINSAGIDKVTFYFSANKKMPPQPISKVASGGELSRLMLAIKYIVAQTKTLPTIIFDEIDTGISGEIADKVGQMIKRLSQYLQVIDITHLPQIAAKADTHILVYKVDTPEGTQTRLKQLTKDERIMEIAKMLSGEKITEAAIRHAKELISG